jgi:hypothetical protein
MDGSMAMREAVRASGLTHRQIEARAGRYTGWVSQTISRPRPGADLVADLGRACGYRLQLVPVGGGKPITIGEDMGDQCDQTPSPTVAEARELLARASSILAALDDREGLG